MTFMGIVEAGDDLPEVSLARRRTAAAGLIPVKCARRQAKERDDSEGHFLRLHERRDRSAHHRVAVVRPTPCRRARQATELAHPHHRRGVRSSRHPNLKVVRPSAPPPGAPP